MMAQTKICNKCGIEKILSEYRRTQHGQGCLRLTCKACDNAYAKTYRTTHKKKIKAFLAIYRVTHKKETKAYSANYNATHKEQLKTYSANRSTLCKKKYYLAYKEKRNAQLRRRRKEDLKFKLKSNMSTAIGSSLKGNKGGRRWEDLVDYALDNLRRHLEKQFTTGMSWENYGSWHIDHIIPISVFNFTRPDHQDFKRCWALSNLQPLWAKDNILKSDNISKHFQPLLAI